MTILESLRPNARDLDESDIVAIANRARDLPDVIPLWVGEGDVATPSFIMDAAKQSLDAGETFYTWQRGIPELRQALATYHAKLFGRAPDPERFFVTGSGMQAIQLAVQALAGQGDEIIMPTPVWPNIHAATQVSGAVPVPVEMEFTENGWEMDLAKLLAAVTRKTKAIFINTPSNPTGWVASKGFLIDLLTFARERGIWIIADEVYNRFYYEGERAPSFYDLIEDQDKVIFVNTFSKNWAMTGWRAGWISAPEELGQVFENLIQYSTSGVPVFVQRGAVAALEQGDGFLVDQRQLAQTNRGIICDGLLATQRVELVRPHGAFYLFFKVNGHDDAKDIALRLIDEAKVGLAPGTGFYTKRAGFLRMCYLRQTGLIEQAAERITNWLKQN